METSAIKNKIFPNCASEALSIIRSNYSRIGKKELAHLANEFIFFNEYNIDQKIWIKVTSSLINKLYRIIISLKIFIINKA